MADWVTELKFSGRQNRTVDLGPDQAHQFWSAIATLEAATKKKDACWRCPQVNQLDYLFTRYNGEEHECVIVSDEFVIGRTGVLADTGGKVRSVLHAVLASIVAGGTAWSTKPKISGHHQRRCTHAAGHHKYRFRACACGSPSDAADWLPMDICEASNCYNYAVKDIWCKIEPARTVGALPASMPADPMDYDEWAAILSTHGIVKASGPTTVPSGLTDGWHIALTVSSNDFHFLRRNGSVWAHKFGQRPPQLCDGAGQPIPSNKLEDADLCGYHLVGYFYVPGALTINP